jgi:hypothetical protein
MKERILLETSAANTEIMMMSGINFMVDERGEKTAVIIDLKRHKALWEDLYDAMLGRAFSLQSPSYLHQAFARLSFARLFLALAYPWLKYTIQASRLHALCVIMLMPRFAYRLH